MGRQSSRLYFQGKDHKDIYYKGHYHDKMYLGSRLVWEKLKSAISWVGYESNGTWGFVKYNGSVFLYIDIDGNLHTSNDAIAWNVTSSPYEPNYILLNQYLMEGNDKFICAKNYRYYDTTASERKTGRQIAVSSNGIDWEPINEINVILPSGEKVTYSVDGENGNVPYFGRVLYSNGKYFASSVGNAYNGIAYSSNLVDWYRFGIEISGVSVTSIEAVYYSDGYYYLGVTTLSQSYVVKTDDLVSYKIMFEAIGARGIWSISKFGNGIIMRFENYIYYSEKESDFQNIGSTIPESHPDSNSSIRASVFLDSNEYVMINASTSVINEYYDVSGYNQTSISDILEYNLASAQISVILHNKYIYIFLNQEDRMISLIGTMEG